MGDWASDELGNLAELTMGQSPPGLLVGELRDGLPFLQGNAEFGVKYPQPRYQCDEAPRRAQPGDVLISVRAPVGAMNVADQACGIGRGLAAVRFTRLSERFGHLVLQQVATQLDRASQGTTFAAIGKNELASLLLAVPPLEEQRAIAEVLDTVNATIRTTERGIAKLRSLIQGLVAEAVECALRTDRPRSLGEIADDSPASLIQTGPFGSQLQANEYIDDGVPVFMPTDIRGSHLDIDGAAKISKDKAAQLGRHQLQVGDLLLSRRGDLSRCAVVTPLSSSGICGTGCLLIRVRAEDLPPDWLAMAYRHEFVQRQVLAQAVGSTMPNLSASLVRSLEVPRLTRSSRHLMPSIQAAARQIETDRTLLRKLHALRAGLASDLLSGRVRTVAA